MRNLKNRLSIILALFVLFLNIFSVNLSVAFAESVPWIVTEAAARQDIRINNPTNVNLIDIPVIVRLNSSNIPNKDGVSFYLEEELLSSELVSFDENGISIYWIKIPVLSAGADTIVTAYYSVASLTSSVKSTDVWSDNYELVQHFSEKSISAEKDSTGNGILSKTETLTYKNDDIGASASFTGIQKISYKNKCIGANANVFSTSAVVKFSSVAGTNQYYGIVCRDRNGKQAGDTFMLTLSNDNINSSIYENGKNEGRVNIQSKIVEGTAYLLTMTYDGTNFKMYINGALIKTVQVRNASLLNSELSPFTIGAYSDNTVTNGLKGDLYDVFLKTSVINEEEESFRYANYFGNAVTIESLELNETQDIPLISGKHYLYDAVVEDTYCFSNGDDGRNANFGLSNTVMQKRTNVSDAPNFQSSANRRAFIKLDLSKLASIASSRIESVTFDFYQTGNGGITESVNSRIVDVDPKSWSETDVTWINMPSTYNLPAVAQQTIIKQSNEYQSFDITDYVKTKLTEGKTFISFSLDNEPSNEWGLIWNSREASENRPRITVNIKEPTAPEISEIIENNSAVLTAQIEQAPNDVATVDFYKAKTLQLAEENTVVYSGETSDSIPDMLTVSDADNKEVFKEKTKTTVGNGKTPYQIYEIALGEGEKSQREVDVIWKGNTGGKSRSVTAYFYSHTQEKWIKADSGSSEGSFDLKISVPLDEALDTEGKLRILIWRGMNEDISGRLSYAPKEGDYDFNVMWSTDTQKYMIKPGGVRHVEKQFNWIVDNFESTKSKLFLHTGDVVENYDSTEEWQIMSDIYKNTIEKAEIPYAVTVGNHDVNRGNPSLNIFQNYFPVSRLQQNNPYFGESLDDMTYYYLMEESGAKLMFVGMGMPITQEAVEWINNSLSKHPDYTAVLMPHIYLLADGSIDNTNKYGADMTVPQLRKIIESNDNVKLVLCGHWDGASTNLEYFGERPVWSMMHDYQGYTEGGNGYFRLLKFDIENNLIYTHTYSASTNGTAVYTDKQSEIDGLYQKHRDEYAINFDFGVDQERFLVTEALLLNIPDEVGEQIGATQYVTGTGTASVTWDNLKNGENYSWYAVMTDESDKKIITGIRTFIVPKIVIKDVTYSNGVVTVNYIANGISNGTPISVLAFSIKETDGIETIPNNENMSYQNIFAYDYSRASLSFRMPNKTENGVAGLDTTKTLLIKLGGEYTNVDSKIFKIPSGINPEILSGTVNQNGSVNVKLNRSIHGDEVIIVASYNDRGELIRVNKAVKASPSHEENEYTVDTGVYEGTRTIKIMWWSSLGDMQPLCETKEAVQAANIELVDENCS